MGWRENEPEWTTRVTMLSQSIAAVGDVDVILAPAGPILGLLFSEDNPYEIADTSLLSEVRLLIQGVEDTIISYDSLLMTGDLALTSAFEPLLLSHDHVENVAAAYTQNVLTQSAQPKVPVLNRFYGFLFDEYFDPDCIVAIPPGLDTRLRLRATATGTIRVIVTEMFTIPERRHEAA